MRGEIVPQVAVGMQRLRLKPQTVGNLEQKATVPQAPALSRGSRRVRAASRFFLTIEGLEKLIGKIPALHERLQRLLLVFAQRREEQGEEVAVVQVVVGIEEEPFGEADPALIRHLQGDLLPRHQLGNDAHGQKPQVGEGGRSILHIPLVPTGMTEREPSGDLFRGPSVFGTRAGLLAPRRFGSRGQRQHTAQALAARCQVRPELLAHLEEVVPNKNGLRDRCVERPPVDRHGLLCTALTEVVQHLACRDALLLRGLAGAGRVSPDQRPDEIVDDRRHVAKGGEQDLARRALR
eukprot:scaffold1197_cov228-Pinguiococcus_pyrenoidosus.AAC.5